VQHRQELLVLNRCRASACIPSPRTVFLLSAVARASALRSSLPRPAASLSPAPLLGTGAAFRDRALIGVMVYSFARVGAGVTLRVEDYFEHGKRSWLRLHERREGSEVPCHHNLEAYLEAWIEAAGIAGDKNVRSARATN